MKILITGGTGFLGKHLIPVLSEHSLVLLSRSPREVEGADVVIGDVLAPETLQAACSGCDVLIHAAGRVSHRISDADNLWTLHVQGTENMLAAAKAAGIKTVIYISTSGTIAVSQDPDFVANEASPSPLPLIKSWPYYRSKLFAEEVALSQNSDGFKVICLNPSLLLGPGDELDGASTESVRLFLDGRIPASPPGGISFVDVRDTADAIALAIENGKGGRRYLLGGANMSFSSFYGRLSRISGQSAPVATMPKATRKVLSWFPRWKTIGELVGANLSRESVVLACHSWYVDSSRARQELNWNPRDPQQTLEDTVLDLQQRGGTFAPWPSE